MTEPLSLFNTLTRKLERLEPLTPGVVGVYACGPTVYNYAHIGNLRTYVLEDMICRTIRGSGYRVKHVMNITDVGHLQSDADEGEDKMQAAAAREQRSPWEIAKFYEQAFFADCESLNILRPDTICNATGHIQQMIEFVQELERRGFTYEVDGNIYFSVERCPDYGKLAGGKLDGELHARVDPDPRKRDPRDFVLWFSKSKFPKQVMMWDSPWGRGFPGWHIECSAMASQYLGERLDIHMGGVDHVPVHHTNEIAQSESRFGHDWVKYWLHCEFLVVSQAKMAKSSGSFLTLAALVEHGIKPVHYRYWCLGAHYRSQAHFSWEALEGARSAFQSLYNRVVSWKLQAAKGTPKVSEAGAEYQKRFWAALRDDFNAPSALGVTWEMARDQRLTPAEKFLLIQEFDGVLGLGAAAFTRPELPADLLELVQRREAARKEGNWKAADELRDLLVGRGVRVKDLPTGSDWYLDESGASA